MSCKKEHSAIQEIMKDLPVDQGGKGRYKCAACAYEQGFRDGYSLREQINLVYLLDGLDESQAKEQRHKSPHAAYAKGYLAGVNEYYRNK